jgi:hypothetical protein
MLKIEELFAFVAEDAEGEGLMGFKMPGANTMMPMVGGDMKRVASLYPIAEHISKITGKPFRVLKFSTRKDITEDVKRGKIR